MKYFICVLMLAVFGPGAWGVGPEKAGQECVAFGAKGCYFSGAQPGVKAPLLIYYRGFLSKYNYPAGGLAGGHITGQANILSSARSALNFYGLKKLAQERGFVVLVTGSSDISVVQSDVDQLQSELGYAFPRVYVAAHSGGNSGLRRSIGTFDRVDSIVLLDPFYSDFSASIRPRIVQGAACSGFYTPHNAQRYEQYFSDLGCSVQPRSAASDHENWVAPCLQRAFSK